MQLSEVMLKLQDRPRRSASAGRSPAARLRGTRRGLGLEVILGAFVAGAILRFVDRDVHMTHPAFPMKLEAIGYGFLIPAFFVSSGLGFDLDALTEDASVLVRVPVFLVALQIVRGVPALLYRPIVGGRGASVAALLQATSLPFIAGGRDRPRVDAISETTASAMIAAGLPCRDLPARRADPAAPDVATRGLPRRTPTSNLRHQTTAVEYRSRSTSAGIL